MKLSIEIAIILSLCTWLVIKHLNFQKILMIGMLFAAGLILTMIVISSRTASVHPDEFSHLAAYQYYVTHILPPAVDDPATIPSTSVWGYSYLFELDIVYDLAAHATGQLREWSRDPVLAARMFQFALWAILCILAACRRNWAAVLCVALLSPQIWYVFSYFNGDAFPLFLSLVTAGLVVDETNGLNGYIRTGDMRSPALWWAALCIALLLVSKRDYLPVVPMLILWIATIHLNLRATIIAAMIVGFLSLGVGVFFKDVPNLSHWHSPLMSIGFMLMVIPIGVSIWHYWRNTETRDVLLRIATFTAICIAIATPRVAWDIHVNGWPSQKAQHILQAEEARAGPAFKPSTVAQGKGYPTIDLASRGISLKDVVFGPYHWASISLTSAFGVYGYMNIFAPPWLYYPLYAIFSLVVILAVYSVIRTHEKRCGALLTIVVGGTALVLASSLLLSWTSALQPQGRYLFPILPLIALLIGRGMIGWRRRALALLVGAAFIISACSFCFVALPKFV